MLRHFRQTEINPRMSATDRAKIFVPFAALKGFEQAVEGKCDNYVVKGELTDDNTQGKDF